MNNDTNFIARAREQIVGFQRRRAIEREHAKADLKKDNVEIELFLDACRAEGLDETNPRDFAIILRAWCLKKGGLPSSGDTDWDQFTGGPFLD
jgi:hypothetical protein